MRVTIAHSKPKEEVMKAVDRCLDDLFQGISMVPIQFTDEKRNWQGSVLHFSMMAKMGLISAPLRGSIEVTDRDVTIDVDLGILERILAPAMVRNMLTTQAQKLLQ